VSWAFLRVGSLILALAGLGLLYVAALHRTIPVVTAKDIAPSMNYACVRVAGRIAGAVKIMRRGDVVNSVSFRLDDGTGEITVAAYDARARDIVKNMPELKPGAEIEATGSLGVRTTGRPTLYVEAPGQIKILAPAP
jgi:DNA/RNA endonuclease YhcR with UshA esterase domain